MRLITPIWYKNKHSLTERNRNHVPAIRLCHSCSFIVLTPSSAARFAFASGIHAEHDKVGLSSKRCRSTRAPIFSAHGSRLRPRHGFQRAGEHHDLAGQGAGRPADSASSIVSRPASSSITATLRGSAKKSASSSAMAGPMPQDAAQSTPRLGADHRGRQHLVAPHGERCRSGGPAAWRWSRRCAGCPARR